MHRKRVVNGAFKPAEAEEGFEFCEHMADIAIHAWGDVLTDAFELTALGMNEYMCPHLAEQIQPSVSKVIEVEGHDLSSLLYSFLNDVLYLFGSQRFISSDIHIGVLQTGPLSSTEAVRHASQTKLSEAQLQGAQNTATTEAEKEKDDPLAEKQKYFLNATLVGEFWDEHRHKPGTEVKAITFHALEIRLTEEDGKYHTHVVVDI